MAQNQPRDSDSSDDDVTRLLPRVNPPPSFNLTDTPADVDSWKLWKQEWKNYATITLLDRQPDNVQRALFLHSAGRNILRLYNTFELAEDTPLQGILEAIDDFIIGARNETYDRFQFNNCVQKDSETVDSYVTNLKTLASFCNYCEKCRDSIVRDRLITRFVLKDMNRSRLNFCKNGS